MASINESIPCADPYTCRYHHAFTCQDPWCEGPRDHGQAWNCGDQIDGSPFDHEPDNPQGVWCCEPHRQEFFDRHPNLRHNDGTVSEPKAWCERCDDWTYTHPCTAHSDGKECADE